MGATQLLLKELLPLDFENFLKMSFRSFRWIQMIFGIQMYHEEMQVNFEYGCGPIIIGEAIALGLGKLLENYSFCSFSQ
jgi:hypothetical protein